MSELSEIRAVLYALRTADGGRRTPLFTSYRPSFHFADRQTDGAISLIGKEQLMPGDYAEIKARLIYPEDLGEFLKPGGTFEIREGPKVVGRGIVISVHLPGLDKIA